MKVNVTAIQDNTVHGTIGDKEFSATPFQWGSKMLMKVVGDNTFSQGEKISIGHAAKKALRTAQVALPEAVLKRPRKAKEAEPAAVVPVLTADEVVSSEAAAMMAKLDLVLGDDGFFGLEAAV